MSEGNFRIPAKRVAPGSFELIAHGIGEVQKPLLVSLHAYIYLLCLLIYASIEYLSCSAWYIFPVNNKLDRVGPVDNRPSTD